MRASRRFPRSLFQPGIAAMYACTGASPSALAICGLPPERRTCLPFLVSASVRLAPACAGLVVGFDARFFLLGMVVVWTLPMADVGKVQATSPDSSVDLHLPRRCLPGGPDPFGGP